LILADAALTLMAVMVYGAPEGNPICEAMLMHSPWLFIGVKSVAAAMSVLLLRGNRSWGNVVTWGFSSLVLWDLLVLIYYCFNEVT
jgi:hypothetical protein